MRRLLYLPLLTLVAGLMLSCTQTEKKEEDKVPADVKEAEMRDSTRLDSARNDGIDQSAPE